MLVIITTIFIIVELCRTTTPLKVCPQGCLGLTMCIGPGGYFYCATAQWGKMGKKTRTIRMQQHPYGKYIETRLVARMCITIYPIYWWWWLLDQLIDFIPVVALLVLHHGVTQAYLRPLLLPCMHALIVFLVRQVSWVGYTGTGHLHTGHRGAIPYIDNIVHLLC